MDPYFLQIEMLPALHGDCLWIEYGRGAAARRMLIDGGPIGAYAALQRRMEQLPEGDRLFELMVLTHVDTDHVDGLVRLFAQPRTAWQFDVRDVWFNGWKHLEQQTLGANQGEFFSALIENRLGSGRWNKAFGGDTVVVPEEGLLPRITLKNGPTLTLLSPTRAKLNRMREMWRKTLTRFAPGDLEAAWAALATQKKYLTDKTLLGSTPELDARLLRQALPDRAVPNGASIAFLLEYQGMRLLLLGDAHPGLIVASLKRLLRERGQRRLKVDAVKVAHHGSKSNTSDALLALVESPRFLISSNGAIFRHPDDEAIERIIARSVVQPPELHFNYRSERTAPWDDEVRRAELGYRTCYNPEPDAPMVLRLERAD